MGVGEENVLGTDRGPSIALSAAGRLGKVVEVSAAGGMACSMDATSVITRDAPGIVLCTVVDAITKVGELIKVAAAPGEI